jgi:hypothetical protein
LFASAVCPAHGDNPKWSRHSFLTQEERAERHKRRGKELARAKSAIVDPIMEQMKNCRHHGQIENALWQCARHAGGHRAREGGGTDYHRAHRATDACYAAVRIGRWHIGTDVAGASDERANAGIAAATGWGVNFIFAPIPGMNFAWIVIGLVVGSSS